MLNVAEIARITHEANKAYCEALGDKSQVPWEDAPEWQRASSVHGVTDVMTGTTKGPEDQHKHWMAEKIASGWTWGETKDAEAKTHPCLMAYHDLPVEQQLKDHLFVTVAKVLLNGAKL